MSALLGPLVLRREAGGGSYDERDGHCDWADVEENVRGLMCDRSRDEVRFWDEESDDEGGAHALPPICSVE